eukprot:CAMPEP_0115012696 /NCGR_PEP_ID=MMETSP0216-20121206/24908_1 /TAXON_ID=223996 /ORGANISM="Protocruzia adherens, Strain Boccale" /LENGTH=748 /DNA_ID=CAMNT_0002381837 /DNA_START=628 /DNA_END=2874 /DNA_ORIENTATION=+
MRLKVKQQEKKHTEIVTSVCWNNQHELFSVSDDNTLWKWDLNGENSQKLMDLDAPPTDIHWMPSSRGANETLAVAFSDGSFRLINKNFRASEVTKEAHKGAVISLRWNHEGTSLATAGEDGQVKIWSSTGNPRSTLATCDRSVYHIVWSPNNDLLLYASGKHLHIKPTQAGRKVVQWKGHDGVVLSVDWNPANNLILSGGEDCKYKVWDSYGRNLYASSPYDYVITSLSWAPSGDYFAVGAFEMLKLCDKSGWTQSFTKPACGSIMNMAWTSDGTILGGACGNGSVIVSSIVDKSLAWQQVEVCLEEDKKIIATDVIHEVNEELDFKDRVIEMSLSNSHLVVTTTTQCYIYPVSNWNTPSIIDIKDPVHLIIQSVKYFALVNGISGIQVYNYEGRNLCNPKQSGLRVEFLNQRTLTLSHDILAFVDTSNAKIIRLFDVVSGKPLPKTIEHSLEIVEMALNQTEHSPDRKICLIDQNRDLFITSAHRHEMIKLTTMVDSFKWNDRTDMLAALSDGKLHVWYYPNALYVDKDLLEKAKLVKDASEVGKMGQMLSFAGSYCQFRRIDGAQVTLAVSPYPCVLYEHADKTHWEKAIKLCRYVKEPTLWACLAAMSLHCRELGTAEIALAAIDEIDKVQFINHIKDMPSEAVRNSELALFSRKIDEAETILLNARLIYRAIKLNIRLFRWDRALDLAIQHKTHVDTVLAYRQRFLLQFKGEETKERFIQYGNEVEINWETIKAKIANEKEGER